MGSIEIDSQGPSSSLGCALHLFLTLALGKVLLSLRVISSIKEVQ